MEKNEEIRIKLLLRRTRRDFYLYLSIFTFICVVIAFTTPYWLQSWPRIHTEFKRLGLWEFCMNGYVDKNPSERLQTFYGCWWILAPYFDPIKDILNPPWFVVIQIFYSIVFIIQFLLVIISILYTCKKIKNIERRTLLTKIIFFGQIVSALMTFIVIVIFGCRCYDKYWMPRPEMNWPSWSYGFAVLSCFGMIYCAGFMGFIMREERIRLDREVYNFPTHANSAVVKNKTSATHLPLSTDPRADDSII